LEELTLHLFTKVYILVEDVEREEGDKTGQELKKEGVRINIAASTTL
jgi:hypothetical protein